MNNAVVDELYTPGCPQCAIKHLSAALAYLLDTTPEDAQFSESALWQSVAMVNLNEVLAGYKSHLWYAIGMLVRAEESMGSLGVAESKLRDARLLLEGLGVEGVGEALKVLSGIKVSRLCLAVAHLFEARRELPASIVEPVSLDPNGILDLIARIHEEFFVSNDGDRGLEETAEEGGETTMGKTVAKAAAKGGKTAKACDKKACDKKACAKKGKK